MNASDEPAKEVWFYHMVKTDLERVLPDLLEKTLARGWRALVRLDSMEEVERWNGLLWTYNPASFLPHGTAKDGNVERQPIFLTTGEANANRANMLFLANGVYQEDISDFTRCILVFDGRDPTAVEGARNFWREKRDQGHVVQYWQQSATGKWELKSSDSGV